MSELIQGLRNQIEGLQDGGIISLVDVIEDEGMEVTDNLLIELYNGVKDMNIKRAESINNIALSILVYAK
jgi:RNase adaptor protein for sRNA GlmZ degradation